MKRILAMTAAGLVSAVAFGAQAATYDAVTDFGASPFSYGSGTAGSSFTALTYTPTDCVGTSGLSCYNDPSDTAQYTFPVIGKNNTGSQLNFYTNSIAPNQLFVQAPTGSDAIIAFTAPTTGLYYVDATFARADTTNGAGNGVIAGIFNGSTSLGSQALANSTAGAASTYTYTYNQPVQLVAGTKLEFFVNAEGNINNDGTSFVATISAAPEPGVWALMVAGVAMMGAALRLRRRQAGAVA